MAKFGKKAKVKFARTQGSRLDEGLNNSLCSFPEERATAR